MPVDKIVPGTKLSTGTTETELIHRRPLAIDLLDKHMKSKFLRPVARQYLQCFFNRRRAHLRPVDNIPSTNRRAANRNSSKFFSINGK